MNGRPWPDGSGDLTDPLLIDGLIDDVVARRLSGARTARRPWAGAPADGEELVTALSGLTVIDWPADEAGDRIAQAVAFAADRNEPGALAAPDSYRPIRSGRQRPAGRRRWAVAGVTAAAAAAAILVVATAPFGSPYQGTSGRATAPATGQPGSGGSGRAAPAAHDLPMRLVDSVSSPFRTAGTRGPSPAFLQCVTASVCYAWGDTSEMDRTSDGGASWRPMAPLPRQVALNKSDGSMSCPTTEICVAPASGLQLSVTLDGGAHWTIRPVPAPPGSSGAFVEHVSCATAADCVVQVLDGASKDGSSTFLSTTNGGRTWTPATAVPAGAVSSPELLRCDRSGHCIGLVPLGTGTHGSLTAIRSADGGRTWTVGSSIRMPPTGLLMLSCGDTLHCMAVSSWTRISITSTSDGGDSWRTTAAPRSWPDSASDLSCPTGQDCFIAAADTLPPVRGVSYGYRNPVVEATHDGGRTWAPLSLPVVKPAPLADVYPLSCPSADGCIAGADTVRGKFANGGLILSSFPGSG